MGCLALVWGILAVVGMIIGFVPLLGALNWINIPFAGVGLIICIIALAVGKGNKRPAIGGLIGCGTALLFGLFRLVIGGGIF